MLAQEVACQRCLWSARHQDTLYPNFFLSLISHDHDIFGRRARLQAGVFGVNIGWFFEGAGQAPLVFFSSA